jgi:hypothetical protein
VEPIQLRVRSIDNSKRLGLSLEGTILVCRTLRGRIEPEIQIPVELIAIGERKRFDARRLLRALFAFLVAILVTVAIFGFLGPRDGQEEDVTIVQKAAMVVSTVILLGGFLAFCVLLVMFFRRGRTVCLIVAPQGNVIEFWKPRRCEQAIDALLEGIRHRQKVVEEETPSPAKAPIVYVDPPSLTRKFLAYLYLSLLPAVFARQLRLLVFVVVPVLWYVVRMSQYLRQPAEYRHAVRCYRRKRWDETVEFLTNYLDYDPQHFAAYILLLHVYMRSSRYDDALTAIAAYGDSWPEISRDLYTSVWDCKRVGQRRAEPPVSLDDDERCASEGSPCA